MSKRDRILAAARALFRHYGVRKTTMQDVAREAGVAVGTLYLHFENKDDLVAACAGEFARRHRERAEKVLASRAPASVKLRRYVVGRFREARRTRTGSRHAAELARAVLRVRPDRLREEGEMMAGYVLRILEEGVASGEFRTADPGRDAKVFLYAIAWFFPHALMEMPAYPTEAELLGVVDWFLDVWSGKAPGS
jgi:AcrR family transcriptional regulator